MVINKVEEFIKAHNLITPGTSVILGFSGGPDSTFLLHILAQLQCSQQFTLIAAHLNHGWRAEAEDDLFFCQQMTEKLNVPFVHAHARDFTGKVKFNGSQEDLGRRMRRLFFSQLLREHQTNSAQPARIALAHHQDDQYETFFIRLARGSGLEGLAGMRPLHGDYIRPLLGLSKSEIIAYLNANNISFKLDASNSHAEKYLRSRIRTMALPLLANCDKRFPAILQNTMGNLAEANDFVNEIVQETFAKLVEHREDHITLDLSKLFTLHPYLQKRVLLHWICEEGVPFTPSLGFFQEIERFLHQHRDGDHLINQTWHIKKRNGQASIIS